MIENLTNQPLPIIESAPQSSSPDQQFTKKKIPLIFWLISITMPLILVVVTGLFFVKNKLSNSTSNNDDLEQMSQNLETHVENQKPEQMDASTLLAKFIVTNHEFSTSEARETAHQIIIPHLFNQEYSKGSVLTSSWTFYSVDLGDSRFALIQNYYLNYLEEQNELPIYIVSYYQNTGSDLFSIMSNQNGELEKTEFHAVDLQNQELIDVTDEVDQFNQLQENRTQQIFSLVKEGLQLNLKCEYESREDVTFCNLVNGAFIHVDGLDRGGNRRVGFYAPVTEVIRHYFFDQNLTCHEVIDGVDSSCFINESAETLADWNDTKVAVMGDGAIESSWDAYQLMMTVKFDQNLPSAVIKRSVLPAEFFDLSIGLAQEILREYVDSDFRIGVYGDFSNESVAFQQFMNEANLGETMIFASTEEEAIAKLKSIGRE